MSLDPAIVSFIGATIGGFVASLTVTKKRMHAIAKDTATQTVIEHERACRIRPFMPALTPVPPRED